MYSKCDVTTLNVLLHLSSFWLAALCDVSVSDVLQNSSDWLKRLCELERHDGKWHYCACSMGLLRQKSKTFSQYPLDEQVNWNELATILLLWGLVMCYWDLFSFKMHTNHLKRILDYHPGLSEEQHYMCYTPKKKGFPPTLGNCKFGPLHDWNSDGPSTCLIGVKNTMEKTKLGLRVLLLRNQSPLWHEKV